MNDKNIRVGNNYSNVRGIRQKHTVMESNNVESKNKMNEIQTNDTTNECGKNGQMIMTSKTIAKSHQIYNCVFLCYIYLIILCFSYFYFCVVQCFLIISCMIGKSASSLFSIFLILFGFFHMTSTFAK